MTENAEAIQKTMAIVRELHDSGILDAAESILKAKESVAEVVLGQVSRKEATSLINNLMAAAGVLTAIDPEQTKKTVSGCNDWPGRSQRKARPKSRRIRSG